MLNSFPPSSSARSFCQPCGRAIAQAARFSLPFLLLLSGCMPTGQNQVELTLRVDPANRPGVYLVSGTTNLPDRTPIIIQSIRPLQTSVPLDATGKPTNYTILARQTTEVAQGKWQATLNLWQVAPTGQYREAWQLNPTQTTLQPTANVTFMAMTQPAYESKTLNQQLADQGKTLKGDKLHFTPQGEWYLQAQQALTVGLPTGKTTPPVLRAEDLNGGWGLRSELPPAETTLPQPSPLPKSNQTTAPLSPAQRLR